MALKDNFAKKIFKIRYLPKWIKFVIIIFTNWFFQSFLQMDMGEKVFKIILETILFLLNYVILSTLRINSIIIVILFTHTLYWIFFGNIFLLLKSLHLTKIPIDVFYEYTKRLQRRVQNENSIIGVAVFGSLSKKTITTSSDLDVILIREKGIINWLISCSFIVKERFFDFLNRFPLDIYLLDDLQKFERINVDEIPIILSDKKGLLRSKYKIFQNLEYNDQCHF